MLHSSRPHKARDDVTKCTVLRLGREMLEAGSPRVTTCRIWISNRTGGEGFERFGRGIGEGNN